MSGASAAVRTTHAERLLLDAAQWALRQGLGGFVFVLHMSHFAAMRSFATYDRIGRATMQMFCRQVDGQMFAMANGDIVVLCRAMTGPNPSRRQDGVRIEPGDLAATCERLFRFNASQQGPLVTVWSLETETDRLLRYIKERLAEPSREPAADEGPMSSQPPLGAPGSLLTEGAMADLLHRQRGVLVRTGSGRIGLALRPIYQEITFSIPAMVARASAVAPAANAVANASSIGSQNAPHGVPPAAAAAIDPYVFQHLAGRLDARMLAALTDEIAAQGPLDARATSETPCTLHVNLTLPATSSPSFRAFAKRCADRGLALGVEISFMEASADPSRFAAFQAEARVRGVSVLLDGVSLLALAIMQPTVSAVDFVKLDWPSPAPDPGAAEADRIDAAINRLDAGRVILQRAETEAALQWGLARGIRRFQGRHVDAMLGANRMIGCAHAHGCTVRQCVDRAAALSPLGRPRMQQSRRAGCLGRPGRRRDGRRLTDDAI